MSYDDRKGQPSSTGSNEGYRLLDSHFPKDVIISEFLMVESPTDLRTGRGLADLEEMASRVSQIPGVDRIVGVTRPTGSDWIRLSCRGRTGRSVTSSPTPWPTVMPARVICEADRRR